MKLPITSLLLLILLGPLLQSCSSSNRLRASTSTSRSSAKTAAPSKSQKLVRSANKFIGCTYKYGGNGPRQFDCSGLVKQVFAENNVELPRTSAAQAKVGKAIALKAVRPGDLLFFSKNKSGGAINHVAVVVEIKQGKYYAIHSTTSKGVIKEDIMNAPYWKQRFRFARRVQSGA